MSRFGDEPCRSVNLIRRGTATEHHATLTTTLDQGSDSTLGASTLAGMLVVNARLNVIWGFAVKWSLVGVPKGQEETLRGALEGYYVNG